MTEHPFAQYIRAIGRGKKGARSLTREEARAAFGYVLAGRAEPVQVGAFLMLLRVKEETAEELAGFVEAVRDHTGTLPALQVDLDWSSYAGKRKHLPWFVLSAVLLAGQGIRLFMHGTRGHTAGRLYTETAFRALGLPVASDWDAVRTALDSQQLCFMPLANWCPALQSLIDLRSRFGLRSPVHTLVRLANPLAAPCSLQSIFHPAYAAHHAEAARLLAQPRALVIKGDGGEFEYRPDADTRLFLLAEGKSQQEVWPRHFATPAEAETGLDCQQLLATWRGTIHNPYAEAAVIGTTALALRALGRAPDQADAWDQATDYWHNRPKDRLDTP